jgi:type IV pilus assembly protein PilM
VRLGVATNRIGVRIVEVPSIEDPKQFVNAIRFRAQEVLPIPLSEAVLDHVVLGNAEDRDKPEKRVLLVFAHRELVLGYVDACKRAGIQLASIDFDAFALLRAMSPQATPAGASPAAVIVASIGRERTIFAISDGEICDFARVLDWGGASLDDAIATALAIPLDHAERVKRAISMSGETALEGLSAVQVEAARAAVHHELELLSRELISSLQFYQSRPGSLDIGEVLLTGGGAQLDGIAGELGRRLGVPVRLGDPLQRVTVGEDLDLPIGAGSLAIAVGLGIEG